MADLGDSLQGAPQEDDPRIAEKIADPPLADLIAEANAKYAQKDYKSAAELYSRATEKQAEVNGEMSPQNADLLYCYGRCLYHVAISKSDVLGSKVAGESRNDGENASKPKPSNPAPAQSADGEGRETEELITAVVAGDDQDKSSGGKPTAAKPYFQFMGDENFDDSNEEDEAGDTGNDGLEEQEDDEFSDAFEILDLARVLFQKRLDETEKPPKQGPERSAEGRVLDAVKQIQERLADTYDLQAEISLEGEQFPRAVTDLKAALELKSQLFPSYSSLIAETHYKLSLALEFASVTQQMEAGKEVDQTQPAHVDEALREEAAKEMEAAIASCKQRIEREEVTLAIKASGEDGTTGTPKITRESVDEVKEMVQDMEQRLVELRQPPVSINDPTGSGSVDGAVPLSGVLGSILGESPQAQKERLEQATKDAKDLTNLVKRKPRSTSPEGIDQATSRRGADKRPAEHTEDAEEPNSRKRAKAD